MIYIFGYFLIGLLFASHEFNVDKLHTDEYKWLQLFFTMIIWPFILILYIVTSIETATSSLTLFIAKKLDIDIFKNNDLNNQMKDE